VKKHSKRTLAIGDVHGNAKGLRQCLHRSGFDLNNDELISLGDICDGFPYVRECFEQLLDINHLVFLASNHDRWAEDWFNKSAHFRMVNQPPDIWYTQGGKQTLESYKTGNDYDGNFYYEMPVPHLMLLRSAKPYHIDEKNRIYVHGGFNPTQPIELQDVDDLVWDRDLLESAWKKSFTKKPPKLSKYSEIFVGHTSTQFFGHTSEKYKSMSKEERIEATTKPLFLCNLIALDTGGGWGGKVTIMDVDTKEYWQSDVASKLYPEIAISR
jgi:serine/threonine protein phosphatase 1